MEDEEEEPCTQEEQQSFQEELMRAMSAAPPSNLIGLPQGMRHRSGAAKQASEDLEARESTASLLKTAAAGLRPSSRWEIWALGLFFIASAVLTGRFIYQWLLPQSPGVENWRRGCRQCRHEWWDDFWSWRLKGISASVSSGELPHAPPEGMEWEWGNSSHDTDWFGASPELVSAVVKVFAEPSCGPVLQVGCGDSPMPMLLDEAGFAKSEHLDVAPEVVTTMRARYKDRPDIRFVLRDFLSSGPPPPAHRFGAVVDKAGIWDWLQEEAPHALPRLLSGVRKALVEQPCGVYVIATKQTPRELSATLSKTVSGGSGSFLVEHTHPLGKSGIAWAYVLIPA